MSPVVLSVKSLSKTFFPPRRLGLFRSKKKPFQAVKHISFSLKKGEILGILGPNGAGKTTTIEMLLGTLTPTSGEISYFGKNFFSHTSEILQSVSAASAYLKLPSALTVQQNLEMYGRFYGLFGEELKNRIDGLLAEFGIESLRHVVARALSAGQMTRVMLIKAFLPQPKVLLLDEPTASLDPDIAVEVRQFILKEQKEREVSVILTSHNMEEVAQMCDRALVMQHGTLIQEDTPKQLAQSAALSKLILGGLSLTNQAISAVESLEAHHTLKDGTLLVELDEALIAPLLQRLAQKGVCYTHIEIEKPDLEDYFLMMSKNHEAISN